MIDANVPDGTIDLSGLPDPEPECTCRRYILDENGNPVPEHDLMKWARWFETAERRVAVTSIDGVDISTVFLGTDHQWFDGPPLLYETMIFGSPKFADLQWRYSTREEAREHHAHLVEIVTRYYRFPFRRWIERVTPYVTAFLDHVWNEDEWDWNCLHWHRYESVREDREEAEYRHQMWEYEQLKKESE